LALSSRNGYLSNEEREAAAVIHRALLKAKETYKGGERNASKVAEVIRKTVETEPRARLDYVNISSGENLERIDKLDEQPILITIAVYVGKTRLIDNILLNSGAKKKDSLLKG
jgi:pantoate--beta-alanine ligase